VPANLEASRPRKRLAKDQAGSVVESFERLRVELVDALLTPGLGGVAFGRPPSRGSLAKNAIQPAARDERCVGGWTAQRLSPFLGLLTI
jgi:hypothetical protein